MVALTVVLNVSILTPPRLSSLASARAAARASVPIPKFANTRGIFSCELRNQRDTSNSMSLVPLLNPKFALGLRALACELRVRGTSSLPDFGGTLKPRGLDPSPQAPSSRVNRSSRFRARASRDCGLLPLPKGEGWGEGLQTFERFDPPHPNPLPCGERESRRAAMQFLAHLKDSRQQRRGVFG